jgi:RNA polymerase sigma factor (sigma-70 family)
MDRHRWRRRVGALRDRLRSEPVRTSLELGERLAVWDAVETLPERQRAAVYLRFRADLAYEQIGEVLGIAAPSARSHVSRALDALRLALGEEETR